MSRGMKIRIKDSLHSKLVQKVAFREGYGWWSTGTDLIKRTDAPFIYLKSYENLKGGEILCGYNEEAFNKDESIEVTLETLYHFKEVEKEVVELNGKRYLKEELEKALSLIKPLD